MSIRNAEDARWAAIDDARRLQQAANRQQRDNRRKPDSGNPGNPVNALKAKRCRCANKHTYRNEDGELRCLCGRAV